MNPFAAANPVTVTERVVGLAGTTLGLAGTATRQAAHVPVSATRSALRVAGAAAGLAGTLVRETAHVLRSGHDEHVPAAAPPGPTVVLAEPSAPSEPPVDVVGQALAAEDEAPSGGGLAHEPRGASRDEEHGDAALQRAEVDEIAEEARAALVGDVEPEEHLTQPLVDPADAKAVASEMATMTRAADPDKG